MTGKRFRRIILLFRHRFDSGIAGIYSARSTLNNRAVVHDEVLTHTVLILYSYSVCTLLNRPALSPDAQAR